MMKKNEYDFSVPTRQSYLAIVMILFKTVNVVVRQIFPAILVILIGGSKNKGQYIIWALVVGSVISMIYSIINFFRTYFIIQNNEIILHTGVFTIKKISVPFERIQTINFEQNILHQFFSVLRIKLDTAGSEKNEFEFHAIEADKAYALRELIMAEKQNIVSKTKESNTLIEAASDATGPYQMIMSISPTQLLKVGLTENHIKSGGLILLFFFWIYQNLQEVGVDVDEYSDEIPEWEVGFYVVLALVTFFLVVSVLISLVRTLISHYDLKLLRSATGFKIESGLFTKKEVSALDHKIQHISWSDNLLKRWMGFKDLALNQASSNEVNAKSNIKIPGCSVQHIRQVTETLFGQKDFENNITLQSIDKRYFLRFAVMTFLLLSLVCTGLIIAGQYDKIIVAVLLYLYFCGTRYMNYKKLQFGTNDDMIYIRGGVFGDKAEVMPMFKIQSVEMHQSPYQTRNQLASITLYTASGKLRIPYIHQNTCIELMDLLLYKSESDKRKWM
jgi:putative membrane protein